MKDVDEGAALTSKMPTALPKGLSTLPSGTAGIMTVPPNLLMRSNNTLSAGMAPMPGQTMDESAPKYSDYIRHEKLRKFKRLPRLIG